MSTSVTVEKEDAAFHAPHATHAPHLVLRVAVAEAVGMSLQRPRELAALSSQSGADPKVRELEYLLA